MNSCEIKYLRSKPYCMIHPGYLRLSNILMFLIVLIEQNNFFNILVSSSLMAQNSVDTSSNLTRLSHLQSNPRKKSKWTEKHHRSAPIQIAFGVMTYQRVNDFAEDTFKDFSRLMSRIYEDEFNHIYILHTDIKAQKSLRKTIEIDFCASKMNCYSIPSRSVTWAGKNVR